MKKFLIAILIGILMMIFSMLSTSCESRITKLKKPFVIINKGITSIKTYHNTKLMFYKYQDSNGVVNSFYDTNKYNIGDTLK